jgi:hypothetical protein
MTKISKRVRERPMKRVAVVGLLWLAIMSATIFYAREVPEPAQDAVAVFELPQAGSEQASNPL